MKILFCISYISLLESIVTQIHKWEKVTEFKKLKKTGKRHRHTEKKYTCISKKLEFLN